MVTMRLIGGHAELMEIPVRAATQPSKQVDPACGSLYGAVAVVIGAPWGSEAAITRELGAAGATVVVGSVDRRNEALARVRTVRHDRTKDARACQADANDPIEASTLIERTVDAFGRIDLLVTIAGITAASVTAKRDETWDLDVTADLEQGLRPTRAAMPSFIAQSRGTIINVNAFVGNPRDFSRDGYVVAKRNLVSFTAQLAQKLAVDNVTANCICPGFMESRAPAELPANPGGRTSATISIDDRVARCVRYLADDGRQMVGKTINIEGGIYL
jgi:NAD(P)-dependent dehydrogenase (short-subunit alcohol dehydrogenase family)